MIALALALPLLLAHLLPHLGAFLLINLLTHFFGRRPAHFLVLSLALGHPLGHALRGVPLLVLVLIHVMVLCPALRPMMSAPMSMFPWSWSSETQTSGDEKNVGDVKHLVKSKDVSVFRRIF